MTTSGAYGRTAPIADVRWSRDAVTRRTGTEEEDDTVRPEWLRRHFDQRDDRCGHQAAEGVYDCIAYEFAWFPLPLLGGRGIAGLLPAPIGL